MSENLTSIAVTAGLFIISALPLFIDNLRTGAASNRNNLILAVGGLTALVISHVLGWGDRPLLPLAVWIAVGAVALIIVAAARILPGGVTKTMMVLLVWFSWMNYLLVISVGFVLAGVVGAIIRRNVPMAATLIIAGLGVLLSVLAIDL